MTQITLWHITDCHCYSNDNTALSWSKIPVYPNQSLQALLAHLNRIHTQEQALFITGDLVQEETAATYQHLNQLLQTVVVPVYATAGNHDIPALMHTLLNHNVTTEPHVQFGNWHCLLVDTSKPKCPDGHLDDNKIEQLKAQLDRIPTHEFAIIFMHHHPISINSAWMDVMGLQDAAQFWTLIEAYPQVKAVFNGHIHQAFEGKYTYPSQRTVTVHGTPATCVQLQKIQPTMHIDHSNPAWRSIQLSSDGSIHTQVHYLPLQ